MTWSPDSSTTGGAQTGFTSPVFTLVDDQAPALNAKQKTCTSIAGSGFTATANSISSPFTSTFYKPQALTRLPAPNPISGLRGSIPNNQWRWIVRKGGLCAAGVPGVIVGRLTIDVPAGMDSYNPDEVRAFVSYLVGQLWEESADLGDSLVSGVL
jgi:hypothetical protein